jgi:hypothetical protein
MLLFGVKVSPLERMGQPPPESLWSLRGRRGRYCVMSAIEKGGAEVVALFIWSLLSLRPAVCRGSIQRSRGRFISWG